MSYVNEMENCGVNYYVDENTKKAFEILDDFGANLVRLRLWHTPSWYDDLNSGNRYSDLQDVKRSIQKAKENNLSVLLDFHLSDNWADPSSQLAPAVWQNVVDDLDLLKDSLYNYMYETLTELNNENLLPELIQIGNETNKGILLSPAQNQNWVLDWDRNTALFNHAIKAVEDFESENSKDIKIVLHVAGPANAEWLIDGFVSNGVTNFDYIGLSYYWAWHKPTSISDAGAVISNLKSLYDKEVLIVETGYIWTTDWNDNANNIISEVHPNYSPASPEHQRDWLIDLTKEVIESGGSGVLYWEPFWVSSPCWTQWGQGSHQEHATFFDFDNKLLLPGGIEWLTYDYGLSTSVNEVQFSDTVHIFTNSFSGDIKILQTATNQFALQYLVTDFQGKLVMRGSFSEREQNLKLLKHGAFIISVMNNNRSIKRKKFVFNGAG